jgi:translation initiation factor 5
MTKSIPIKKTTDPFYRYKMPEIEILQIGKKTQLSNLQDISICLKVKVEELFKYIFKTLNTMGQLKNKQNYQLSGNFNKEKIQIVIYDYIEKFILCKICSIPEIKNNVCLACGAINP